MHAEYAVGSPDPEVFEALDFGELVVPICATLELGEPPHAEASSDTPMTAASASVRFDLRTVDATIAISSPPQLTDLCV
jgi:hypothetical protein